ncbi:MAG: Limonene,2-epoxide hydrolase catalytic domain [Solirubrobacteraceae bacterium]|nr:Limonene,2-epoxide hydrolase catalytic domain [Solirubrobacteraceae bacterium]
MSATDGVARDARAIAHRFIEAFNQRDADALLAVLADDAELRPLGSAPLRGHDGARALLADAEERELRFVELRGETAERLDEGRVRLTVPVRELIGPDDIERIAAFEVRDGRIASFTVRRLSDV